MSFNTINFIVNTAITAANIINQDAQSSSSAQNASSQNVQNQGTAANAQNTAPSSSNVNYSYQTTSNTSSTQLSTSSQTLISTVEVEQQANYIKDLLNLPRSFEDLINQIQGQNQTAQALKELSKLLQNGKINLNMLSSLLAGNSKDAAQKLMMTIMTVSKMGSNNVNQLKELMGLLSGASPTLDANQTAKNLLMLYLPWLPLSIRHEMNLDFDIDIFEKIMGANPDEEESQETVKIMIETANYKNVLCELSLALNNEVDVFISAIESFPEEKVLEKFKKENEKFAIRSNVSIEKNKELEFESKLKQNVQVISSNFVSPKLVLAAHSLIKIVIEVDNSDSIIKEKTEV